MQFHIYYMKVLMALCSYLEQEDSQLQCQLPVAAVALIAVSAAPMFESAALHAGQMLDAVPDTLHMSVL